MLVVVVVVTLSGALAHRAALEMHRQARADLAVLRAREAAGAGLASVQQGGPATGALAGGATWAVTSMPTATGDQVLESTGRSAPPAPATAHAMAVLDSAGRVVHPRMTLWR